MDKKHDKLGEGRDISKRDAPDAQRDIGSAYKVKVTVVSRHGYCGAGHEVGDSWILEDLWTPEGICMAGFYAIFPSFRALRFGGEQWWYTDTKTGEQATYIACPDATDPVVFKLVQLPETTYAHRGDPRPQHLVSKFLGGEEEAKRRLSEKPDLSYSDTKYGQTSEIRRKRQSGDYLRS